MTDHWTQSLFAPDAPEAQVIRAPVSRLVVDVERFEHDQHEPMAAIGMGAVYKVTSSLIPMRLDVHPDEREWLMQTYYRPHHAQLEAAVATAIERYDRCLVIDCHSFPSVALPYEFADATATRPDICIGTDAFHTPDEVTSLFVSEFQRYGWRVKVNEPFAGAIVPLSRYQLDRRVSSVMVEVNRRLYLREPHAEKLGDFTLIAERVRGCCLGVLKACGWTGTG
jgi:N-formylglutamate amidohydrolase